MRLFSPSLEQTVLDPPPGDEPAHQYDLRYFAPDLNFRQQFFPQIFAGASAAVRRVRDTQML
jgi:hypothetical protein